MKSTDRAILVSGAVLGLLVLFYFMALAPKREEAAKLGDEITTLEASIVEQEQVASFAEQARSDFPTYYGRMVVLGKAVPADADSASMLVELNAISNRANVDFRGIQLGQAESSGEAAAPAAATPPAEGSTPPAEGSTPPAEGSTAAASTQAAATPAPATEAAAATVPIGSGVGPAGLPTLPYNLFFNGGFFQVADFIAGVDGLVSVDDDSGKVAVGGRMLTIDGFTLQGGAPGSSPTLESQLVTTSYVTPAEQGLTLGAGPGGPAPAGQAQGTPASAEVLP